MPSTVSSCPSGLDCLPILDLLPESWFQSQKPRPFFCEPLLKKLEPGASKVPSGRSVPISLALCTQSLNPLDRGQHRQDARAPFRPLAISRGLPPSLSLSLSLVHVLYSSHLLCTHYWVQGTFPQWAISSTHGPKGWSWWQTDPANCPFRAH